MRIGIFIVCASICGFGDSIKEPMDALPDIPVLIEEYIDVREGVGAAVGWIENGKIQYFTNGKKSANQDDPISEKTVFEIGSITKAFTTLVLMDMANRNEIELDAPLETYIPGIKIPEKDGTKITLRHLAVHTSGIPRMPDNFNPKNPNNPYLDYSIDNLYEYLSHCNLDKTPGEQFEYSNIGMGILSHTLSLKSNRSYEELIQNAVCEQLDMRNTSVSLTPEMETHFAKGHILRQEVEHWDFPFLPGIGGLRSNIQDMTRFLAANMGLSGFPTERLMKECQKVQITLPVFTLGVGLGWFSTPRPEGDIIWHNGGTGGFRSFLGFNPKTQQGVVILTNSNDDWPDELGWVLLDPAFIRPRIDRSLANDPDYLSKCSGIYDVTLLREFPNQPLFQELQIIALGKRLWLGLSGGLSGVIYPESFGVFGLKDFPDSKVHFSFDDEGKVAKIQTLLKSTQEILWEARPKRKAE